MDRQSLINDPEAALRIALDGRQSTIWTAMPCIVQSVSLLTMTIDAQPAIQGVVSLEDGSQKFVDMPLLINVPIVFPSAGGFILTLPIAKNDEVLVVFASRCIDAWWQSGGFDNQPMEMRMHDLSDGFAIPGPRSLPKFVTGVSSTAAQLRNTAGTTYVEVSPDGKVKLIAPVEIDITAPTIHITGAVNVTGALTATSVVAGTTNLATHVHLPGTYNVASVPVAGTSGTPL